VNREQLASFVRARKGAITQCYERELKRNPTLKGRVVVRFTIGTNGRATDVEIDETTIGNDAVTNCIRTIIKGWSFPFKPASEVPCSFPFVFAPAG
jgi:TonB family protein